MSAFQICYLAAIVAIAYPAWGRQRYAFAVLAANLASTLAICLAMDIGAIDRSGATRSMMVADFVSGVTLAMRPGLPRVLAWGYVVTVPIYWANIMHGVQVGTTYGILNLAAAMQLGVLAGGSLGNGGGGLRRRFIRRVPMEISGGNQALLGGLVSRVSGKVQGR